MIKSCLIIAIEPGPGAPDTSGPATVPKKSVAGRSARNPRTGVAVIGDSLSKMPKIPGAVHPLSETTTFRTGFRASLCRHCLQDGNYFQYGAQKFADASPGAVAARSPIEPAGAEIAEIAETPRGLHPVSETAKMRAVLQAVS